MTRAQISFVVSELRESAESWRVMEARDAAREWHDDAARCRWKAEALDAAIAALKALAPQPDPIRARAAKLFGATTNPERIAA